MTYHVEYDGYYNMRWHDDEPNALKRWFDNYKIERYASFATKYEWLVVKEVLSDCKHRKTRLICEIGDDGRGIRREVVMDHTAPPAPVLTFAAKQRYEPPPPKTEQQLRNEAEWNRMITLGYRPILRPIYKSMPAFLGMDMSVHDVMTEMDYKVEWVRHQQQKPDFAPPKTKAPTHRRNV